LGFPMIEFDSIQYFQESAYQCGLRNNSMETFASLIFGGAIFH
jgi:hypothetical protein